MDDDGFIFLGYEAAEMEDESKFLWRKDYTDHIDAKRMKAETKNSRYVVHVQHVPLLSGFHALKKPSPVCQAETEKQFITGQGFG